MGYRPVRVIGRDYNSLLKSLGRREQEGKLFDREAEYLIGEF